MAPRTLDFFQAKKELPTKAAPNRVPRTPSELEGSSAEAEASTLGTVAPWDAESAREVSLAQGSVGWASLQEEGKGGRYTDGGRRGRKRGSEEGRPNPRPAL